MSAASAYMEHEFIMYAFTAELLGTRPTSWKIKLHSDDPGNDIGVYNEISGSGYVAQEVTWTQPVGEGSVSNTDAVTFPTVTDNAYTVTHVSVSDHLDNSLWHGPLAIAKVLLVGEAINFAIGELQLNIV